MNTQPIIDGNSQFFQDLIDESKAINVNGRQMPKGYYNLIITIRDLSLYEVGMKPNRHWKITDVKKYFGIKGTATKMKEQLQAIKEAITQG